MFKSVFLQFFIKLALEKKTRAKEEGRWKNLVLSPT